MDLIDLRCQGTRKTGPQKGLPCQYLLCRVSPTIHGVIETKCPRCNALKQWAMGGVSLSAGGANYG